MSQKKGVLVWNRRGRKHSEQRCRQPTWTAQPPTIALRRSQHGPAQHAIFKCTRIKHTFKSGILIWSTAKSEVATFPRVLCSFLAGLMFSTHLSYPKGKNNTLLLFKSIQFIPPSFLYAFHLLYGHKCRAVAAEQLMRARKLLQISSLPISD